MRALAARNEALVCPANALVVEWFRHVKRGGEVVDTCAPCVRTVRPTGDDLPFMTLLGRVDGVGRPFPWRLGAERSLDALCGHHYTTLEVVERCSVLVGVTMDKWRCRWRPRREVGEELHQGDVCRTYASGLWPWRSSRCLGTQLCPASRNVHREVEHRCIKHRCGHCGLCSSESRQREPGNGKGAEGSH